jgi:predicted RNA-binding Zn ribbon-like protein
VGERATARDLASARGLRETMNRLARAVVAGEKPRATDVDELNRWARRPPLAPQVDGRFERVWAGERPVEAALALVAREAVELLTSPERGLIRECAATPNCSLLYLDRSHGRRRRWCEMDRCGSRAKMTSYRQRRAASATD